MNNDNITKLINGINHITLNHEDLMESVLGFSKIYAKNNPTNEALLDKFFGHGEFIEQSVLAAREGVVLGMNAITLDENIPFSSLMEGCVDIEGQRMREENVCSDEYTKNLMKDFLSQLRKELFSRIYSQNKEFQKITKISKTVLKERYDYFMAQPF